MLLNSRNGFIAVLLWIILGLFGLPVFAGGRGGPGIIFTPTFGYIIGFLAAVTLTGKCNGHLKNDLLLLFLATIAVYLPGLVWIKFFLGVSLTRTLEIGFYPFIILDLLKIAFAWTVWQRIKEQLKTS